MSAIQRKFAFLLSQDDEPSQGGAASANEIGEVANAAVAAPKAVRGRPRIRPAAAQEHADETDRASALEAPANWATAKPQAKANHARRFVQKRPAAATACADNAIEAVAESLVKLDQFDVQRNTGTGARIHDFMEWFASARNHLLEASRGLVHDAWRAAGESKMAKFANEMLSSKDRTPLKSKKMLEQDLGIDHRDSGPFTMQLASAVLNADCRDRHVIEALAAATYSKDELAQYVACDRSDETPNNVTRRVDATEMQGSSAPVVAPTPGDGNAVVVHTSIPSPITGRRNQTPSRILQSDDKWGMGILERCGGEVEILGETITPVQLIEKTTGECGAEAKRRRTTISEHAFAFDDGLFQSDLDQAKSNNRLFDAIAAEQYPSFDNYLHPCESHVIFGCHKKASRNNTHVTSTQVAWSTSINEYAGLSRFLGLRAKDCRRRPCGVPRTSSS